MKLFGQVVKGESIGKKIGFPTVNVSGHAPELEYGVYTCKVGVYGDTYMGVMHYGPKSFSSAQSDKVPLEVHILDFDKEIYGEVVCITVMDKIRDVMKFSSLGELSDQIKKDVEFIKKTNS